MNGTTKKTITICSICELAAESCLGHFGLREDLLRNRWRELKLEDAAQLLVKPSR